jgi:hypothetical protein
MSSKLELSKLVLKIWLVLNGLARGPHVLARHGPGRKRARAGPKHEPCHVWAWPIALRASPARPD